MKRILHYFVTVIVLALFTVSCSSEKEFNTQFLYEGGGKWKSTQYLGGSATPHTIHDVYYANGTGKSWDIDDDVTEAEAQKFKWQLRGATLTKDECMEIGQIGCNDPMDYKVIELTATTFKYSDSGKTYSWTKVN